MEHLAGYLASGLIGVLLGLIGGGGAIITIPILVYLFRIEPVLATTYSLFIVGITSMIGGVRSALNKMVDFRSAVLFSIPSTVAIYLTRYYLLPHIPDSMSVMNALILTKNTAIMIFFSIIMILAAIRMIGEKQEVRDEKRLGNASFFMVLVQGLATGVISGLVGAGGGFLIIPSLVLFAGLPMKRAIGTSLVIIGINAFIGFLGDLRVVSQIDFPFIFILSLLAIGGVFVGSYLSRFVHGKHLKAGFGWFALSMAIYILVKEIHL
jgi:hypothetical protein